MKGDNSVGNCISIAIAKKGCIQDTGAKMFHIGKNTKSKILSKSISYKNGVSNYRGTVNIANNAENSCADISCDTLLVDNNSSGDTIPTEIVSNDNSFLKHEAKITKIEKEKMFCFNSFGIDDDTAKNMIVLGFVKPFQDMLPMEYAVELNRLIKAN
ncbi:hypothetical protein FACS189459_2710 [Bacilli bacterium]|nr:hypothetical protein FACS189459_2710 [Bacilli bacterium]GHU52263.1 hypothetical protein FACS189496_2120 [Bacilli bacterium]